MRIDKNNYEAFFLDYFEGTLSAEKVAELMLFLEQHPELKKEFDGFENISLNELEEGIKFENKDQLKKGIVSSTNFDEIAVAFIEHKLTAEEEKDLFNFIASHPQYKVQLELFRKTILAEDQIVFENKTSLKKQVETLSEKELLLLSSIEGMIGPSQQKQLDLLVASDKGLAEELIALKRTKLPLESTIIFADKDSLKRKAGRVVPLYYYLAAAASIALLLGFFFLSGNDQLKGDQISFHKKGSNIKQHIAPQESLQVPNKIAVSKEKKWNNNNIILTNDKVNIKKDEIPVNKNQDEPIIVKNEIKVPDTNSIKEVIVKNDHPVNDNKQNILVNSFNDQEDTPLKKKNNEYLSLGETFAYKMKSKMLGDEMDNTSTYKEDRKKFTWYDAVLITMKGIRSLTGREVDVHKKYNEQNELVAYEFTAGKRTFTKSIGKKAS